MRHDDERTEAPVRHQIHLACEAVDLRVIPGHGKEDGRVEQHVEVVGVVGPLVEIAHVRDNPTPDALLETHLHLITLAWQRRGGRAGQRFRADSTREQEVLVVRCFHRPAVRGAQHGVAVRNRVRHAHARLQQRRAGETVIVIEPEADLDGRVAGLDVVLHVGRLLLDRPHLTVRERRSAPGQVERQQVGIEIGIHRQRTGTLAGGSQPGVF